MFITQQDSGEAGNPTQEEGSHNYIYTKLNLRMDANNKNGKEKEGRNG